MIMMLQICKTKNWWTYYYVSVAYRYVSKRKNHGRHYVFIYNSHDIPNWLSDDLLV